MKSKFLWIILAVAAIGFLAMKRHSINFGPQPTAFTNEALKNQLLGLNEQTTTIEQVLEQYKGETVIIDVWASWCGDCIRGLPKVREMQKTTQGQKINYLFLSVDEDQGRWQRAIKKHDIRGEHYLVDGGWKSDFGNFLKLDWIPRYLVVNPDGTVGLYKATKADDPAILETALANQ